MRDATAPVIDPASMIGAIRGEDPLESMEHRSRHRVFRIGEIPLEIRAADRRQCDKDECRGGGDRDAKGVQHMSFGFLRSCELVVQHLKFFGERL